MSITAAVMWLIIGAVLLALEALGLPGFGLFFAGLAAISVGILTELGIVAQENAIAQFAWFFGLTGIWALFLWKPLKNFYSGRKGGGSGYSNIVGEIAEVDAGGLAKGIKGKVRWSGTWMSAELAADAADQLPEGAKVTIVAIKGNTLIVK